VFAQIREQLADDAIQAIGRLRAANTGLASHLFCDIRLPHSDFTLSGEIAETARPNRGAIPKSICGNDLFRRPGSENHRDRHMN
jgi:hypothetical protein